MKLLIRYRKRPVLAASWEYVVWRYHQIFGPVNMHIVPRRDWAEDAAQEIYRLDHVPEVEEIVTIIRRHARNAL